MTTMTEKEDAGQPRTSSSGLSNLVDSQDASKTPVVELSTKTPEPSLQLGGAVAGSNPLVGFRVRYRTPVAMTIICCGGAMTSLDSVIISTALPSIAEQLSATTAELAWIGAAYLLASAVWQPLLAPLSDNIGRKPVLCVGMGFFLGGSLVAALAQSPSVLIVGRVLQGLGGGNIQVLCNLMMVDLFPLSERALYIAMFGAASCTGAALGPILGGALTQLVSWRWCFWINVPIISVTLLILVVLLDLPRPSSSMPAVRLKDMDWPGVVLIAAATTLFLVGLQFGGAVFPWDSDIVLGLLIASLVAICLFFYQQSKHSCPTIPLGLFRARSSAACLCVAVCHGLTYIAALYYLPIYFQIVLDATPVQSGTWLLLAAAPMSVITVLASLLIRKLGRYRGVLWTSAGLLALGNGIAILLPAHRDWTLLVIAQLLLAGGIGPLFQAPLIALMASVPTESVSRASGTLIFLRTIASAVGLVVGQVVLQQELGRNLAHVDFGGLPAGLADQMIKHLGGITNLPPMPAAQRDAIHTALALSMSRIWAVYTTFAGFGFLASLLVRRYKL
jgi:EmrB/QacA subfamily drug resistance transporter